jgi:hypothetical protein
MMKKLFVFYLLVLKVVFWLSSCNKKNEITVEEQAISSSDATTFREETDQVLNEVSNYLENTTFGGARLDGSVDSISVTALDGNGGATTATAYPSQKKLVLSFVNADSKDGQRKRSGKIVVQLDTTSNKPKNWNEPNAELMVYFQSLKITRNSDGKFIIINGTKRVRNITGGRAIHALLTLGSTKVVHEITGNISVTFEDGTQRNWSLFRKREFEYQKITLLSTRNDNVTEEGVNRFGNNFITSISVPVVLKRLNCNTKYQVRVVDGRLTHQVGNKTNSIEFGFNALGNRPIEDCQKTSVKISFINRRNQPTELILTMYRNN